VFELNPKPVSDVFSLAATTHVCLFAELPFPLPSGEHVSCKTATIASANKAEDGKLKLPEIKPRNLPDSVLRTLELALHPDPNQRLRLHKLIDRLQATLDTDERRRRKWRRLPAIVAGAAAALVVGITIGATQYGGSSEGGSLVDAALENLDPLTRAEIAAKNGDGEVVLAELNRINSRAREMSAAELERAIARTVRITEVLETTSPDHAAMARSFAIHFREMQRDR
jgi:hypothetical protein